MSLEIAILFSGFVSAVIFYRLGHRIGSDVGFCDGYFAHKRVYDEAKARPRDNMGRFTQGK